MAWLVVAGRPGYSLAAMDPEVSPVQRAKRGRRRAALAVLLALGFAGCAWPAPSEPPSGPGAVLDRPGVRGTLVVSAFGDTPTNPRPTLHTSVFVNGPDHDGLRDIDMRGFLDGNFKVGWNQATQVHVRMGRREIAPEYGEYELFRTLLRWDGIDLPPASTVEEAELAMRVDLGPPYPLRVLLYEVKQDWNPGQGGTQGDNLSPPAPGEAWWKDRAFPDRPWGLPGVGFASDDSPEADTAAMPLAEARYEPKAESIRFRSPALAAYVTRRVRERAPLLLLMKLSDLQEDIPGSMFAVSSADFGDFRNTSGRPRLTLRWRSEAELTTRRYRVFLEHGRSYEFPRTTVAGGRHLAVSFVPEEGSGEPNVEVRIGEGGSVSPWTPAPLPFDRSLQWFETRVTAVENPLILGEPFTTQVRDTWVRTAPEEKQNVPFRFISPDGTEHVVRATYEGEHRWSVTFVPDEPGPWRYYWSHNFYDQPFRSPDGRFDVVLGDRENGLRQLRQMLADLDGFPLDAPGARERMMERFTRLERACLLLETPDSFSGPSGAELRGALNAIRERLGGVPVPEKIPLEPFPPPEWAR